MCEKMHQQRLKQLSIPRTIHKVLYYCVL